MSSIKRSQKSNMLPVKRYGQEDRHTRARRNGHTYASKALKKTNRKKYNYIAPRDLGDALGLAYADDYVRLLERTLIDDVARELRFGPSQSDLWLLFEEGNSVVVSVKHNIRIVFSKKDWEEYLNRIHRFGGSWQNKLTLLGMDSETHLPRISIKLWYGNDGHLVGDDFWDPLHVKMSPWSLKQHK